MENFKTHVRFLVPFVDHFGWTPHVAIHLGHRIPSFSICRLVVLNIFSHELEFSVVNQINILNPLQPPNIISHIDFVIWSYVDPLPFQLLNKFFLLLFQIPTKNDLISYQVILLKFLSKFTKTLSSFLRPFMMILFTVQLCHFIAITTASNRISISSSNWPFIFDRKH